MKIIITKNAKESAVEIRVDAKSRWTVICNANERTTHGVRHAHPERRSEIRVSVLLYTLLLPRRVEYSLRRAAVMTSNDDNDDARRGSTPIDVSSSFSCVLVGIDALDFAKSALGLSRMHIYTMRRVRLAHACMTRFSLHKRAVTSFLSFCLDGTLAGAQTRGEIAKATSLHDSSLLMTYAPRNVV